MNLNTLNGQMLGQLVATVQTTSRQIIAATPLRIALLIFRGGDLLSEGWGQDEVGDLAKRHLHLLGIDALALVLSTEVTLDPLELEQHELVELAVLIALVRGARQLRLQLRDARCCIHDVCSLIDLVSDGKTETTTATPVNQAA
jgi:hypothetical protein